MPANDQKIEALNEDDLVRLATQRKVIEKYLGGDPANLEKYMSVPGKLGLLRALLTQNVFKPTQTYELQCMGIIFGDALVQHCGVEWKAVEDRYGRDPCVQYPGSTVVLFPLTMISKRVEKGETVDVFELFKQSVVQIERLKGIADKTGS